MRNSPPSDDDLSAQDKPGLAPGQPVDDDDALETSDGQYVSFAVGGELFAVPTGAVQEIIRVPQVAHLPLAPPTLDGLANLRGRVLPIINLRRLLGCAPRDNDDATRALVIHIGQPLGFLVDRVASVLTVEPGQIESADAIQSIVNADYLQGVIKRARSDGGQDMLMAIDFGKLIQDAFQGRGTGASVDMGSAHTGSQADDDAQGDASLDERCLVSFTVADQEYALDIAEVQEIVQLPERVSALPNTPPHLLGMITLRQRLLPLVSLRALFDLPDLAYSEQQRIVVIALPGGQHVGLVTDAVKDVLRVPLSLVDPLPGMLAKDLPRQEFSAICRLDDGKRLVSLIATDRLLKVPGLGQAIDGVSASQGTNGQSQPLAHADTESDDDAFSALSGDDDAQVVVFRLGDEEFGVPIMSVQEIVRVPESLTRVPRTPEFVEGVINLRGTVLPVIDQRKRLGMDSIARCDSQRILVYMLGGLRTGFIVDSVAEVLRIPRQHIVPAPALSAEQSQLIARVANLEEDQRLVMLIEPERLLQGADAQAMQELGGSLGNAPSSGEDLAWAA
jgi:purine-binding chemotaxis protein CheW